MVSSVLDVGTAMLGVLLLLSLTSLVALVPPPSAPPVPCSRCCDHLEPEEGSGAQPPTGGFVRAPEVLTYINMTILKGTTSTAVWAISCDSQILHCVHRNAGIFHVMPLFLFVHYVCCFKLHKC